MAETGSLIGTLIGNRYQVLSRLGAGGMAVVYRVTDVTSGEDWALKVMSPDLAQDVAAQRRFKAEHRVMAQLDHPGIPRVQGLGLTTEGLPCFAMELVTGESLETLPIPLSAASARALLGELLPIVAHLHQRGLVHGDLKVENLMRATDGRLRLMDYGLAGPPGNRPSGVEGTVTHLAPELIQRGRADQRADLYAIGVLLYRLLTGRFPHPGPSAADTLRQHVEATPTPPGRLVVDLPAELDSLVMRLLAKRPQDRPQSAGEVLRGLGLSAAEEDSLTVPLQGHFVGRVELLRGLVAAAGEAVTGHRPRPVALVGSPGSGKTRVLDEVASQARLLDVPLVFGAASADGAPFSPWLDLSRDLLAVGRQVAPELVAPLQQALTPFTGGDAGDAGDPGARLWAALSRLVERVASGRGLVVLIDDWHLADPASQQLLSQLLEATTRQPVAWLLASQEQPEGPFQVHPLPWLTLVEAGQLVSHALGGGPVPAEVVEQLHASTQGNPKFLEDLLRHLLGTRQLARRQAGWALSVGSSGGLPSGIQALYVARLATLEAGARRLLEVLAVHGAGLPQDSAAEAAGLTPEAFEEAVAMLGERQLVRVGDREVGPADTQLAAWLAEALAPDERRQLHGALARALAPHVGAPPVLRWLNGVAHHTLLGPSPQAGLSWLMEAARHNMAVRALHAVKRFARAAADLGGERQPGERLEVLELLATAHRSLDEADEALALAEEAVGLAEGLGEAGLLARSLNGLGKFHQLGSRYDQARAAFERAAEVAGDHAPLERCRSLRALGRLAFFAGDLDGAYRLGREALALARRHAQPRELSQVLAEVGETFQGEEARLQDGLRCLEEATAIARELQNRHLESVASAGLGNLQLSLGQLVGARSAFSRAAELYEEAGVQGEALFARLNLALVAEEQGHFVDAEQIAAGVAADARRLNRKFPMAAAIAVEGAAAGYMGRTGEGLARLAEAVEIAEGISHTMLRALIRQLEAPLRCLLGQFDLATSEAESLLAFGKAAGAQEFCERAHLVLGEVALACGDAERALGVLGPLTHSPNAAVRLRAHRLQAEACLGLGDEAGAYQGLHAAQGLLPDVGAPREEAPLRLLEAALEEGDVGRVAAETAIKQLEATQQRHVLPLALASLAGRGEGPAFQAARRRARELIQAMAAGLGEDAEGYMHAFGRQAIAAPAPASPSDQPASARPGPPRSLAELCELAGLLSEGLGAVAKDAALGSLLGANPDRAARRLEQVVSFARAVNSSLQLDDVVDRSLALIIEITGAERGMLLLKEGNAVATSRYATAPNLEAEDPGAEQYSRTIARTVLDTGETLCVMDALSDPRFAQQASILGMNLQTIIAVPLKDQSETIGAIYVDRQGLSDQFTQGDLEIVQALAGLTAVALVNARLVKQQMDNILQLDHLNRLSRSVSRTLELEKVLDIIAQVTLEVVKAERCLIFLWENEQLIFGAGRDVEGPLPPQAGRERSGTICQKVVDTLQAVHVIDTGQDAELSMRASVLNLKIASVIAVPLIAESGLTGVLYIDSRARATATLEKEVAVVQAIANTAALAVQNARHYREATIDHLTGLYVRSMFLRRTDEEVRRTRRFGGRFSLLVLDIDHFKRFNDTWGHQTGDNVLRVVARTLREAVRVGLDVPCRYGGEEMVILLPETDTAGAVVTAERIRKLVEGATLPGPDGTPLNVTVSIGVATFPAMASSATELFERADEALYASKRNGRNQVSVYEPQRV
ncbi:MAG: diguanylate cyclase [Candidatus Sericytochromatia bacterium]|nr:diguanylate cyclase [Candidatus Sericytochromatia bacterium]